MKATRERTPAPFARGERVEVAEENIRPWIGTVTSVKWSPVSGWWIDVRHDDSAWTQVVVEALVRSAEVLRTVGPDGLTSCCGAASTYVDETECCKACYEEVVSVDTPTTVRLTTGGE